MKVYRKEINSHNVHAALHDSIIKQCGNIISTQRAHVKWYITVKLTFQKATRPDVFTNPPIYLRSSPFATTISTPLKESLLESIKILEEKIDNFTRNGSGWRVYSIQTIDLNIAK